jgi:feruloyl-CoA synthase
VLPIDDADLQRGLRFDGRIAEDFKLSTGTFVNVGPLRMKIVLAGDPLVQDVVIAGLNHDDIGALIFPRLDDAKKRFGLPAEAGAAEVLAHPGVRAFFQALVDRMWAEGTGSANRVARAIVLEDPPHIDRGEVTDKGSINQRAVLTHRAELVERLYADVPGPEVILPRR